MSTEATEARMRQLAEDMAEDGNVAEVVEILRRALTEPVEPLRVSAWWCPRCEQPDYGGEPDDGCTGCGYRRTE